MTAAELAERLGAKRVNPTRWKARCLAHEDKQPSLQITTGKTGAVLLKCWGGCDYDAIADELERVHGIKRADLCGESRPNGKSNNYRRTAVPIESRIGNTDMGNAMRLVVEHGENLRYVHPWRRWLWWDGKRWASDANGYVARMAKQIPFSIAREAEAEDDDDRRKALRSWANASESVARQAAMIELAKSDIMVAAVPDDFDRDSWLFNCATGTIDLHTGEIRPHRREDLITKLAPVSFDFTATCPRWERYLKEILPSPELRTFVQRAVGYSLTGDVSEQLLFIAHGKGENGKSVFVITLSKLLGEYAQAAAKETFTSSRDNDKIPNDLASMVGARLVSIVESAEGRYLDEATVKAITGGDPVRCRFMRAEWFSYYPTYKPWLISNHKPRVRGTEHAIWRRIRLIPFAVTVPPGKREKRLALYLQEHELPGILRWGVKGCLDWQRDGLNPPTEVSAATAKYREEQDPIGGWVADRCVLADRAQETVKKLYANYADWCAKNDEKPISKRAWGQRLDDRQVEVDQLQDRDKTTVRVGIRLRSAENPENDPHHPRDPLTDGKQASSSNPTADVADAADDFPDKRDREGHNPVDPESDPHDPRDPREEPGTPPNGTWQLAPPEAPGDAARPLDPPCPDHGTAPGGRCACWRRSHEQPLPAVPVEAPNDTTDDRLKGWVEL